MFKKIFDFILSNKKKVIIIVSVLLVLIIIGVVLILFVFKEKDTNEIVKIKDGEYANDLTTYAVLQPIEPDDITYNIYGDIGTYNSKEYKLSISEKSQGNYILSSENTLGEYTEEVEVIENTYDLSNTAHQGCNHCVVTINQKLNPTQKYDIENISWDSKLYLNAYIELPDGSLITVSSAFSPIIQINIYENEIRIVLEKGNAYFRIAKQDKDKMFTVQIADKIFATKEGAEFFAYTYGETLDEETIGEIKNEFVSMIGEDTTFENEMESLFSYSNAYYLSGVKLINGDIKLTDRTFLVKEDMTEEEYIMLYYYKMGGDTETVGNVIYISSSEYISAGYYESNRGIWGTKEDTYSFLDDQIKVDNLNIGFEDIVLNSEVNTSEILTSYSTYFQEQFVEKVAAKKLFTSEFFNATGWTEKQCATLGYYYVSSFGVCCPEGYQADLLMGNCSAYSTCPTGKYLAEDNKCCTYGYVLSTDKTECVGVSNETTDIISSINEKNYSGIDSSKTYTCVAKTSLLSQFYCPSGLKTTLGAYISKDGQCCY